MATRPAEKAGSWYTGNRDQLDRQLTQFLDAVPDTVNDKKTPIPKARVVICPHAGYSYSGPCAAWSYKLVDLTGCKRIFLLGPSHTYYLRDCAATTFAKWRTPFGDLTVDTDLVAEIRSAGSFRDIPAKNDAREHCLEMQLPLLWKRLSETFGDSDEFPQIVPFLIGSIDTAREKVVGSLFAPYMADPENVFIISSDFCHWGSNFDYRPWSPTLSLRDVVYLGDSRARHGGGSKIHETIEMLDKHAMKAVEGGRHDDFAESLRRTGNTVCGRHPIGVAMAALEELRGTWEAAGEAGEDGDEERGLFRCVRYERSDETLDDPEGSSVSYVSAYAVL